MKRLIILLLQAVLVAAIIWGTYFYTENRIQPKDVLVFSSNLPRHTKIMPNMLSTVTVPDSPLSKVMSYDKKEVLGKYTGSDVVEGEPVYPARLLDEKNIAPEALLRGDLRKQSFEVDLARSNGGALKPGDYVDLLYYIEDNSANTARSDIFIHKIPVLDVRNSEAVPLNSSVNAPGKGGEDNFNAGAGKRIPAVITVAVTPDQARQVVYYRHRGKIDVAVYPENMSVSGSVSFGSRNRIDVGLVPPEQTGAAINRVKAAAFSGTGEKGPLIPPKPAGNAGTGSGKKAVTNIDMNIEVDNGRNR